MTEHAVVVAGGGPTGLMLAGELALAGVDVAIVERRESQDLPGSRAGGLHSRTIEVFDQRGIADRFLSEGQVAQVAGFSMIRLDISDFPTRHPYGLRQLGAEQDLVGPLGVLGVVSVGRDDYERARRLHEEAGLLARKVGDGPGLATSLNNQAYVAWITGDVERAETLWEECLAVAREAGTSEAAALAISGLGDVALARGSPERAGRRFRDALAIYAELGFLEMLADMCVCLAAVAKARGGLERAALLLGAAASLRQMSGAPEQPAAAVLAYLDDVTASARAELGDEAFAAAFARGRARSEEVVDEEVAHVRGGGGEVLTGP